MDLGGGEILLILIVALLIYGGRLPEVARAIGKSMGELKRGLSETKDAVSKEFDGKGGGDVRETLRDVQRDLQRHVDDVGRAAAPDAAKEDITLAPKPDPGAAPSDAMRHEHPN